MGALVVADLVFATTQGVGTFFVGVVIWGVHMGLTQGILARLVTDSAPEQHRGTAFGVLNLVSGVGLLVASAAVGWTWDVAGPERAFMLGAAVALVGAALARPLGRSSESAPTQRSTS